MIHADGKMIYQGIRKPFEAMRYHSLVTNEKTLPGCLEITAKSDQGELMGLRHRELPIEGVQFHPESIMTPDGIELLKNFLASDYEKLLR